MDLSLSPSVCLMRIFRNQKPTDLTLRIFSFTVANDFEVACPLSKFDTRIYYESLHVYNERIAFVYGGRFDSIE